ncbi:MAG: cell division protein FtsZ [Candidatus Poribacteria bacterium]|nr:cell division protein FtsZ [Candidatus Poribacteria bacterium]
MLESGLTFDDDDQEFETSEGYRAKIKVIGVGGGGSNAVNRMMEDLSPGVAFYAVNTDIDHLKRKVDKRARRLAIGPELTSGLGAGANPDIGAKAAEESREALEEVVSNADMVFVAAGMGGGTGTGAAPLIAQLAREMEALTIGVVTRPFKVEGPMRARIADSGIRMLEESADAVIVVPNQKLLEIEGKPTVPEAKRAADGVLAAGVKSISELVMETGDLNLDFADVQTAMKDSGTALMGIGEGHGDDRAEKAARNAITSPLIEQQSISGAAHVLVNVTAGPDFEIAELDLSVGVIEQASNSEHILLGYTTEEAMEGRVRVTVIAAGFQHTPRIPQTIGGMGALGRTTVAEMNQQLRSNFNSSTTKAQPKTHQPADARSANTQALDEAFDIQPLRRVSEGDDS